MWVQGAVDLAGTLQCEPPSQNLHAFQGRFTPRSSGVILSARAMVSHAAAHSVNVHCVLECIAA